MAQPLDGVVMGLTGRETALLAWLLPRPAVVAELRGAGLDAAALAESLRRQAAGQAPLGEPTDTGVCQLFDSTCATAGPLKGDLEGLVSTADAASRVGVSLRTFWRRADGGGGQVKLEPAVRGVGTASYWRGVDVVEIARRCAA